MSAATANDKEDICRRTQRSGSPEQQMSAFNAGGSKLLLQPTDCASCVGAIKRWRSSLSTDATRRPSKVRGREQDANSDRRGEQVRRLTRRRVYEHG